MDLKKIKDWFIIKLGGITKDQQEVIRVSYEKWAVDYLTGKNGEVTPNFAHYIPYPGDDIVIIRSRISITNARITAIKIAPWCNQVVTSGLIANSLNMGKE